MKTTIIAIASLISLVSGCAAVPLITQDVANLTQCVVAHDSGGDIATIAPAIAIACGPAAVSDVKTILAAVRAGKATATATTSTTTTATPAARRLTH